MNYRRINSRERKNKSPALKVVGTLLVFALFFHFFLPGFLRASLATMAFPFWKIENYAGTRTETLLAGFRANEALFLENKNLQTENARLKLEIGRRDLIALENDNLRTLLGIKNIGRDLVTAVLVRPPQSPYDTFVLSAGSDRGISLNDPVYIDDNVLIGKIDQVQSGSSRAMLLSSAQTTLTGRIAKNPADIEIIGKGGGNFEAKIPQDFIVAENDLVYLPDQNRTVIGQVGKVIIRPNDPYQYLLIVSPFNAETTSFVLIQPKATPGTP